MSKSAENYDPVWADKLPNRIFTIPNILTMSRILLLPVLIYSLHNRNEFGDVPAIVVGSVMIITDLLDGWLARLLNQYTKLGWLLDPISDKLIIGSLALFFAIEGELPYWIAIIVIGRDLAILSFGLPMVKKKILPKTNLYGRLSPFFWGLGFALLVAGLRPFAWTVMIIALVLCVFSAGMYYVEFKKAMEI